MALTPVVRADRLGAVPVRRVKRPPRRRFAALVMGALLPALVLALAAPGARVLAAADKKKGGGETYLQLPTLTAAVIHPGGRRGVLMVDVGLDIPDAGLRARAAASIPILRDAYTQFMLSYGPSLGPSPPNPDAIAADLQRVTDRVLGRPGATLLLGTTLEN